MAAAQIAQLRAALSALRKGRDTALAQLEAATRRAQAAEARLDELAGEIQDLQRQNDALVARACVTRIEGEKLRAQLRAKHESDAFVARLEAESHTILSNPPEPVDDSSLATQLKAALATNAALEAHLDRVQKQHKISDAAMLAKLIAANEERDAAKAVAEKLGTKPV